MFPVAQELNSDPRLRVVAAVGAQVLKSQREQLLASVWRQVDGIRTANAELRHAQVAREPARRLHARHVAAARSALPREGGKVDRTEPGDSGRGHPAASDKCGTPA